MSAPTAPTALITGSAGFIGRHMAAELSRRDYQVARLDLATGNDLRDYVRGGPSTFWPHYDLVVHCAYHVGGRAAIDGEPRLLARNLELDAALFEWAARVRPGRVLYFSSSAAYPTYFQRDHDSAPLREDDIQLGPTVYGAPDARYGWAKLTGEHLAGAARAAGVPVTVVRPFSGYGADQDPNYPFRAILDRARARMDPLPVWGPGTQVRDWIHVDDLVAAALAVAQDGTEQPVNLCTGVGWSMLDLARICADQVGYHPTLAPQPDRPVGVAHRVGDPTLMRQFWRPQVSLHDGVARALAQLDGAGPTARTGEAGRA